MKGVTRVTRVCWQYSERGASMQHRGWRCADCCTATAVADCVGAVRTLPGARACSAAMQGATAPPNSNLPLSKVQLLHLSMHSCCTGGKEGTARLCPPEAARLPRPSSPPLAMPPSPA